MGAQGNIALQAEINSVMTSQTQNESIDQTDVGGVLSDIAISARNITDDITATATGMTVIAFAAAIVAQTLIPGQWIYINNRSDGKPLYVQAITTSNVSPVGFQTSGGKTFMVIMDYINGREGITNPFIASFDSSYNFWLQQTTGNANGSISTILKANAVLSFGAVTTQTNADLTITVAGAAVGDPVILGVPAGSVPSGAGSFSAWVSATNTVSVRFVNASAGTLTPASGTFNVTIIK